MMGNGLVMILGLDNIVNTVLSLKNPLPQAKLKYPEQEGGTVTLKNIPETDKPLIRGLMLQLSDESNPRMRIAANRDIQYLLDCYEQMRVNAAELIAEYLLRKRGLPYMRPHIESSK